VRSGKMERAMFRAASVSAGEGRVAAGVDGGGASDGCADGCSPALTGVDGAC
jgi:hypothetical protein